MQLSLSLVSYPVGPPGHKHTDTHTPYTPGQRAFSCWATSYPNGIATVEVP